MRYNDYFKIADVLYCWQNPYKNNIHLPPKSKQYIHYTTLNGFKAMFEPYVEHDENYIRMFPSQVQYLNDSQEYKDGLNIVNRLSNSKSNYIDNVFAVCFCGEEDLLSQWKHYGHNCGVAIEFDFDQQVCFRWWNLDQKEGDEAGFCLAPYPVLYKDKKLIYKYLRNQNIGSDINEEIIKTSFIPYCKNITFEEERESRIIFFPIQEDGVFKTKIRYRVLEDKIIPQFECKVYYDDSVGKDSRPPIPIKNIMVGPGYNQLVVFNGIINMLEKSMHSNEYIDEDKVKMLKEMTKNNKKISQDKMANIETRELSIVTKNGSNEIEYITYKTKVGITVQMSATPFRS